MACEVGSWSSGGAAAGEEGEEDRRREGGEICSMGNLHVLPHVSLWQHGGREGQRGDVIFLEIFVG